MCDIDHILERGTFFILKKLPVKDLLHGACTQHRFAHKYGLFCFLSRTMCGNAFIASFLIFLTQTRRSGERGSPQISSIDVAAYNALREKMQLAM
jgi:hypothetical protein